MPVAISCNDEESEQSVAFANAPFCALTGYALDELEGRSLRVLDGKETETEAKKQIHRALRQGRATTVPLTSYDKQNRSGKHKLRIQPVVDHAGKHRYTISLQLNMATQAHLADDFERLVPVLPTGCPLEAQDGCCPAHDGRCTGEGAPPSATDGSGGGMDGLRHGIDGSRHGESAASTTRTNRDGRRKTLLARVIEGTLRPSLALRGSSGAPLDRITLEMERTIGKCCRFEPAARPAAYDVREWLELSRMPME